MLLKRILLMNEVPTKEDWGEYWKDIDQKSAFDSFFGKSNEEMQRLYFKNGNQLMTEIRFMPSKPFSYYILGLKDFIQKGNFPDHEASDFASYFLDMVEHVIESNTSSISANMKQLFPTLKYIAENQDRFDAPVAIYGDFANKLDSIINLCVERKIDL